MSAMHHPVMQQCAMSDAERATVSVDVSGVAPAGGHTIVVDVFAPRSGEVERAVLFCFPGGGMSRRYYDIAAPAELGNFSMARHLAQQGVVVVTVDHLGVGESRRPDDGYALTPAAIADANVAAVTDML